MKIVTCVGWLVVAPLLCGIGLAQTPRETIHLDVVVTGKTGTPVGQLQEKDFTVLDNNVLKPMTSFRAVGSDAPVEVLLVVDAVNGGVNTVSYERQELAKFFQANDALVSRPVTLSVLTDRGLETQNGSTRDGKALEKAVDGYVTGLRSIGRSTGFYGAEERLQLSLGALRALVTRESKLPGRKLLIFVSPGWNLLSGPRVDLSSKQQDAIFAQVVALSDELRHADITLYAVDPRGMNASVESRFQYQEYLKGVTKPSQTVLGDLSLQVLATQSGGLVLNGSNDMAGLVRRCVDDASAYYEIRFLASPSDKPDEYHKIDVTVDQPGLTARTRQSYYTQPGGASSAAPAVPPVH